VAVTAHQTQHALFVVDAVPTGANIECMQNSSKPFTIIFTITHKRAHTHMRTHMHQQIPPPPPRTINTYRYTHRTHTYL